MKCSLAWHQKLDLRLRALRKSISKTLEMLSSWTLTDLDTSCRCYTLFIDTHSIPSRSYTYLYTQRKRCSVQWRSYQGQALMIKDGQRRSVQKRHFLNLVTYIIARRRRCSSSYSINASPLQALKMQEPMSSINKFYRGQCDQIWRFLKVLGNKFAYKSSSKDFWTIVKKIMLCKNYYRGYHLETFGHFFAPTSGHTNRGVVTMLNCMKVDCGGGQVVNVLAFYSNDRSLNHAKVFFL